MKHMHIVIIMVAIALVLSAVNTYVVFDTKAKVDKLVIEGSAPIGTATASDKFIEDDAVKGSESAQVTIVEFSDYQCPYCRNFAKNTYPDLVKNYIDTGKAKFVYRDFPLSFHEYAQKAAEASECAHEQGKYWEYHEKLFTESDLSVASLKKYASDLGLDTAKFNDCLDTGKMKDEVAKDMKDGQSAGISGTPAFLVNDNLIVGACPIQTFKDAMTAETAGKRWSATNCVVKVG